MSATAPEPPSRNPATLAERRGARPPWTARTAVEFAVHMLPAQHRERYALEFYADLHALSRKEQRRQALDILLKVQRLAWALGDAAPDLERRPARRRRDPRCVLHLHHYVRRHLLHPDDGVHFMYECTRCRREVFIVPADGYARSTMAFGSYPPGT